MLQIYFMGFQPMMLAFKYALFAFIATLANIVSQDLVVRGYQGSFDLLISVMLGTVVGLIVKYLLDKRYIFNFRANSTRHGVQTFVLYAFIGLLLTIIFWAFEFGFYYFFETKEMRYLGGAIGLAIG